MSSDGASSAVTYTSVSSKARSWSIPTEDPYEEATRQELEYIANSDSMEEDSIYYPDEPEAGDEDHEEDPSKEHEPEDEDHEEDPSEEHEPEDEDTEEEEPSEGSDETEPFEEDETTVTPPPPPKHHGARISIRPQPPMATFTQALIDAFTVVLPPSPPSTPLIPSSLSLIPSPLFLLPPTSPTYDQAPLGHRVAMIHVRDDILEEDMPPWRKFVLTAPPPGCDVALSFAAAAAARPPRGRVADRVEDDGYVRALQASKHRMMTFIEEVNLKVSYEAQIDVVRGQRTAYKTELHERQSAKDRAVRHMMRTHVLEARA
ncbi:hypothetical protein Tco_1085101 [Tanacetum coccineum]